MRFLSSSALASAEKLRLAASCSAAETIRSLLPARAPPPILARQRAGPCSQTRHEARYSVAASPSAGLAFALASLLLSALLSDLPSALPPPLAAASAMRLFLPFGSSSETGLGAAR